MCASEMIIDVQNVTKTFRQYKRFPGFWGGLRTLVTTKYQETPAVEDVTFSVRAGESVGYLGPNGAGKSTMIKMLTGVLVPSAGRIRVLGFSPHEERLRNALKIGVVFGQRSQLWWDLPVIETFLLHKQMYRIPDLVYEKNLQKFDSIIDILPLLPKPARQLSLGQRMRCDIALALLHDPEILFLDEPTIGLDILAKDALREFLRWINREHNTTIILTSHDLQDIESLCGRLVIVDGGSILFDGELSALRSALGVKRRIQIKFFDEPPVFVLPGTKFASASSKIREFTLDDDNTSIVELLKLMPDNLAIRDVAIYEPTIENVIRDFYQRLK